ncbi:MAG: 50S ribosomal protein L5 [Omnitrophica WOR_2 bacterium RIFCSPHIGHO2_02_FULL_67_20]|nr:MAG: 50S ribosomal protein L5 [Omnitrophica WOR_2 bacterium RIFCSPHIGHO2_02_FULL_67_20]
MVQKQATTSNHQVHQVPRLLERYRKELSPGLVKQFKHTNPMAAARLEKIVVNIGCGEAAHDAKHLESVQKDLGLITGQKPLITRAKKAISNFKLREQDPVGCKVTLRRTRMYEFLDRLVSAALPRIRDFRGLNPAGFDQGGNYSFGIKEHTIFPEIQVDQSPYPTGMDIVIVTTAESRDEAYALLKGFGMPFATKDKDKDN